MTYFADNNFKCIFEGKFLYFASTYTELCLNTLRPRKNGRRFPDDITKCIFLNEYVWISIKISLKFVPKGPIDITPALGQIMAWCRPGNKPLSDPMMVSLPTHICVTRPQGVKGLIDINLHWFQKWIGSEQVLLPEPMMTEVSHMESLGLSELKHILIINIPKNAS